MLVIPAKQAGLRPASESRNPVIKGIHHSRWPSFTGSRLCASPLEAGSLGRDDGPYAIIPRGETEHPQWPTWEASAAQFAGDGRTLYGSAFGEVLAGRPDSVFVAKGSAITVHPGRPIA